MNMKTKATTRQASWSKDPNILQLAGEVDFSNAVALLEEGKAWLQKSAAERCTLNMGSVTYANSAGVALIMGLSRTAGAINKSLTIQDVPANLVSMMRLGGLDWLLENGRVSPPP